MRTRRAFLYAATAFVALVFSLRIHAGKTDIRVDFDKTFPFKNLKTWTWHPDGPGDVKLAVSSNDDPKRVAARVDPVIVPALEREIAARGLTRRDEGADAFVHYYVLATLNVSGQVAGQFLPAVPQWGIPPFTPQTTALAIYPVGTLVVDIMSASDKAIVWRGAAERKIDLEKPDAERKKVLESALRDLLSRFPPKK